MTQYLPTNLLALFSARPPIPFKPPVEKLKKKKNAQPYGGVSDFISSFEDKPPALATRGEFREEKDERRKKERDIKTKISLEEKLVSWDPHTDANASGDPFKTLFVGRINYDTSETKLRRELEAYGPVRRIQIVYNMRSRKPRGYAFVEFEHEKDMHSAYKHADGKKIDGRRILVDVERGRTVKSWRPRRLGGGLGGTRIGGPDDNIRHSGRVEQWERDRTKEKSQRRSRSPRDRSEKRGDRERPRDDKPRDDKPRDDRSRDSSRTGERGDRDRKRERGGGDEKDRDRPKRSRDDEKKEEPTEEKKDRRDRDRDSRRDRDGARDRRDRDRGKDRTERGKDRDEPGAEEGSTSAPAENHTADTNGEVKQEEMAKSNGEAAY